MEVPQSSLFEDALQSIVAFFSAHPTALSALWWGGTVLLALTIAWAIGYYQPNKRASDVLNKGKAYVRRPRQDFLIEDRNRVFEALDRVLEQIRTRGGNLSLLLFRIEPLDQYRLSDLKSALQQTVQDGDVCGLIDGRDFLIGLHGFELDTARRVLGMTGTNLLQVVDAGDLYAGFVRVTDSAKSASDLHTEALNDRTLFGEAAFGIRESNLGKLLSMMRNLSEMFLRKNR